VGVSVKLWFLRFLCKKLVNKFKLFKTGRNDFKFSQNCAKNNNVGDHERVAAMTQKKSFVHDPFRS
jgi:hypothetical protein